MWVRNGESATRQVNKLKKHGLVGATYFSGGRASVYATELGQDEIKKIDGETQ
jgi:hypothetical protein